MSDLTFDQACTRYLNRNMLKAPNTIASYRRALDLFLEFLADRRATRGLPIAQHVRTAAADVPLCALVAEDAPIFSQFAAWLIGRGYKDSTVRLRLAGAQRWFQFLDDYNLLPPAFPLAKARRIVRDEFNASSNTVHKEPPTNISEAIYYYDNLELPDKLQGEQIDPERVRRWELTRLRNRALMHCLAETGGRISEVLSLNVGDFPPRALSQGRREVLRVQVEAKGKHRYYLRFFDALPAIRAYIEARGPDLRAERGGDIPLFATHSARYGGRRMSRYSAWHVVDEAARALGIGHVSPHDFRHWRATQLINDGHPLDVVQDYLGHRSVETTRAYYARTNPRRVDAATRGTRIPHPDKLPD